MSNDTDNGLSVVHINELELDKECVRLPSDYLKYAYQAAEAKQGASQCKADLDVVESDLRRRIRDTPGKYGIEKVTESALSDTVLLQPDYREALRKMQKVQHRVELASAVVWALEHKKKALVMLVDLHGMGYFSNPKISRKGKEAVEEMAKHRVRRAWAHDE